MNTIIEVAAGIIFNDDNHLLIARKKSGKPFEGLWEFPGGKVEKGEDPATALNREVFEELGIEIFVLNPFHINEYKNNSIHIKLKSYLCKYISGKIVLTDHDLVKWIQITQITDFKFAPADTPIIEKLKTKSPEFRK